MEAQLWSRLPVEIVERVLSFLHVPDLCRYSIVCKRWNHLISMPEFGGLCLQNAKKGSWYIVARFFVDSDVDETNPTLAGYIGWSILDLQTKRWYKLKESDLYCGVFYTGMGSIFGFVAVDEGLVCQYTEGMCNDDPVIEVYNPLTRRECRVLPNPPQHSVATPDDALINLVVDEGGNGFKVYFIYKGFKRIEDPNYDEDLENVTIMHIYESTTNQWRSSSNPPFERPEYGIGRYGSSIMFQGLLYVLFSSYDIDNFWLFTYDIKEDVWEDTSLGFDVCSADWLVSPQLIMSDNRLFMMYWIAEVPSASQSCCRLCIEEILLEDVGFSKVFQMTGELVKLVFHLPEMEEFWRPYKCPEIQAFGFDKSIMLMSKRTGISIVYDLELGMYSQMPTNPIHPLPSNSHLWYGKPMTLRLPSILW